LRRKRSRRELDLAPIGIRLGEGMLRSPVQYCTTKGVWGTANAVQVSNFAVHAFGCRMPFNWNCN